VNDETNEVMVVVVFPDGKICTVALEVDAAVQNVQLLAPPDLKPVEAPLVLLLMACALLPDSQPKFHAFKALSSLRRQLAAINDRMTATAEPSSDELPF
jgi:hypothetical protein